MELGLDNTAVPRHRILWREKTKTRCQKIVEWEKGEEADREVCHDTERQKEWGERLVFSDGDWRITQVLPAVSRSSGRDWWGSSGRQLSVFSKMTGGCWWLENNDKHEFTQRALGSAQVVCLFDMQSHDSFEVNQQLSIEMRYGMCVRWWPLYSTGPGCATFSRVVAVLDCTAISRQAATCCRVKCCRSHFLPDSAENTNPECPFSLPQTSTGQVPLLLSRSCLL